ncbi:Gfo/Idh/MocA family protein [Paenibacillus ginsengarvi]|uniref:Gfo/Idh/MocA family oxidoreductase n=1 Tax=Paenibacillus ginsengarvi TaxID=400777 RepID=A0A3B0BUB8_9BACL|nr:Gfo/Idh/MocA family oxidoreductase [Paenibacillus ginsengarvi]RKN76041.1 gfo/Idh/MocA family oxidoreductase [Paenibacillus ginsengarvi]
MGNNGKIKLAVIGLGGRGRGLLKMLLAMDDVEIPAVCDAFEDRLQMGLEIVENAGRPKATGYANYRELLARDDVQGVVIATTWVTHAEIAIAAMRAGKYAALEVGGAASLEECWELVRTSEQTGKPAMLLENCCYGRNELAVLNMVKQGLLGELIHCQCGYEHDLRHEVALGEQNRHNRYRNYLNRNGELYPIHGLGPISKILNVNNGNRLVSLTSMSSKARGIRQWATDKYGETSELAKTEFAQGDIVTTMVKCAKGETIMLVHDTTLPRPYSRAGRVQGTKGLWMEDNNSIHVEGRSPEHQWEPFETYRDQYEHPIWKQYIKDGVRGGHGGMDHLVLRAFAESVRDNTQTPIDVYDTAVWMAITVLSEESVALGSAPVAIPDFTKGKWISRAEGPKSRYSLDTIDESLFDL